MLKKLTVVTLLAAGILASQDRFDFKVRNYFFAGFAGSAASLEKGMKICENVLAENPKHAEAMVWHGAGLFYQAGQLFQKGDMQNGQELWARGLKEMDGAVVLEPDNLGVRIPRGAVLLTASHYVPSPDMAKPLIEKGLTDFEKAYDMQSAQLDSMGTHPRGELLIGLADSYSRLGNQEKAQEFFERIQKDLKGTPYEKSANIWLETKTLAPRQAGCLGCHTAATTSSK
jgi:tetratricopeptide (TPR) repeat protein